MSDPHVAAVVHSLGRRGSSSSVIDVGSLQDQALRFRDGELTLSSGSSACWSARGWIRRYAEPNWSSGTIVGSREGAVKSAWFMLLAAVLRTCGTKWLTSPAALTVAENKLIQYMHATDLQIPIPQTLVAGDVQTVWDQLGTGPVVKPLGPGHFVDSQGNAKVVFAQELPLLADPSILSRAPFICQERLIAEVHLRIVTVLDRAWCCVLVAPEELDWRRNERAHGQFRVFPESAALQGAIDLARSLELGFSSQDWIQTSEGTYFVDANPSGQWMFLPEDVSREIVEAIVDWLVDDAGGQ